MDFQRGRRGDTPNWGQPGKNMKRPRRENPDGPLPPPSRPTRWKPCSHSGQTELWSLVQVSPTSPVVDPLALRSSPCPTAQWATSVHLVQVCVPSPLGRRTRQHSNGIDEAERASCQLSAVSCQLSAPSRRVDIQPAPFQCEGWCGATTSGSEPRLKVRKSGTHAAECSDWQRAGVGRFVRHAPVSRHALLADRVAVGVARN